MHPLLVNPWLLLSFFLTGCAIVLLVWAALHDFAARTVPNILPVSIFAIGICIRLISHDMFFSLAIAFAMFVVLFFFWRLGAMGGADVKLWSASVLLVPGKWEMEFSCLTRILLAGGVLALVYLALRLFVKRPGALASGGFLNRVMRAEAWRISRKAPLPYAFAIAGGTIVTMLPFSLAALR